MKFSLSIQSGALALLLLSTSAAAHHSYAMFDRTKQIKLQGVFRQFEWTNPHIFIELAVPGANGEMKYSIEGTSPGVLRRQGWKYDDLKIGDKVEVMMSPLKDGQPGGSLIYVMKDGVKLGESDAARGGAAIDPKPQ